MYVKRCVMIHVLIVGNNFSKFNSINTGREYWELKLLEDSSIVMVMVIT